MHNKALGSVKTAGGYIGEQMEDKDVVVIPYIVHEGDMARQERTIKRLWILCILLVILLCGSNAAWFYHESQYEDVVTTTQEVIQANDNGTNNFVGGDGVITNGKADCKNNDNKNP